MKNLFLQETNKIKKKKKLLEDKLKVKITIKNNEVSIEGESVDKYEASIVLEAVEFGFPVETSLLLKDPEFILTKMVIKDFTNRKDSSVVKGRLIGTHGKTKTQ